MNTDKNMDMDTEIDTEIDTDMDTDMNTDKNADRKITTKENKNVSFDVNMDKNVLYDYMVHHAYSSAGGVLGTCFGFMGVLMFYRSYQLGEANWLFLIIGLLLIFYMPINLKYKAFAQMKLTEAFQKPLHYELDENGITVSQDDTSETIEWDRCLKAVSTRLSIVVYTGKRNASVFPRKDLGDKLPALVATISQNMNPKKVKIRY